MNNLRLVSACGHGRQEGKQPLIKPEPEPNPPDRNIAQSIMHRERSAHTRGDNRKCEIIAQKLRYFLRTRFGTTAEGCEKSRQDDNLLHTKSITEDE